MLLSIIVFHLDLDNNFVCKVIYQLTALKLNKFSTIQAYFNDVLNALVLHWYWDVIAQTLGYLLTIGQPATNLQKYFCYTKLLSL